MIIFGSIMSMAALPIFAILIGNSVEARRKSKIDENPKNVVDEEKTVDTDSLDSNRTNSPSQLSIATDDTSA